MQLETPDKLPATLDQRWAHVVDRLGAIDIRLPATLAADASRILAVSDFVLNVVERQGEALIERLADPAPLTADALVGRIGISDLPEPEAMSILRRCRNVEMARIAWRDQSGQSDLSSSLAELSALADAMIRVALDYAVELLEPRFGRPTVEGQETTLLVLGMGKLGGFELNFSSDIDLVFLYADDVEISGPKATAPEEYFRRLAQTLIRLLDQKTEAGFVFRVDTRLRPFGMSGPLAISLSAFEAYLVQHGRDWERYAYVKARLITGLRHESEVFEQLLTPFVFRRYLDYGVFDALRQMKRLIAEEVRRKEMESNIKLGPGGIREIEFIVQVFQLVRGGQERELREQRLLIVLGRLADLGHLPRDAVEILTEAYCYLRTVENRLQAQDDQQTHDLPRDPGRRDRLAYSMGLSSWAELAAEVDRRRESVAAQFAAVAWVGDTDTAADAATDVPAAWQSGDIDLLLSGSSLAGSESVAESLRNLRESGLYRRMDEPSRQRLSAVVVRLVPLLEQHPDPGKALGNVLPILQAICRRSAYLALLNENPMALERLLRLGGGSPLLARQMTEHPALLDELLDARLFDAPPTRDELKKSLQQYLANVAADDAEAYVDAIRQFQRAAVFRIAIADRLGGLPLMKVSDRLTDTAELVLESALDVAWRELESKHGPPMHGEPGNEQPSGFAVIAYGKLGGLELGYGSDLDLVFLHDSTGPSQQTAGPRVVDNQTFFVRLVQRLIHFLTIQTSSGRLYEIDTRLRPSGASGLMVASWQSFTRYQREQAWTWEHQALLRSRSVAGSASLRETFERERREVLVHHVKQDGLAEAIANMRARMRQELSAGTADMFDIKQDPGGLADIEFLIDYWILSNAPDNPDLVTYPDNVRQLEALDAAGLVPADVCDRMKAAYLDLRARIHELSLGSGGKLVPAAEFVELRRWIVGIWEDVLGESPQADS